MDGPSDEDLLAAYRTGDVSAFETLLARYRAPLFNVILRILRDRGRAEEVYQDVWLRVLERSQEFRGDAKFSTWLYRVARNRCIDERRKMRLRDHPPLEPEVSSSAGANLPGFPTAGASTAALAVGRLARDRIVAAVEALPDDQREVFLLRHVQGLAFREIAEVVGVPTNTVKSRMRYALERLQNALAAWKDSDEL